MKNKYFLELLSIIIGLFFLLSGLGKIVNTIGFTNVLESYGLGYLSYTAPLICVGEIILGLLLVFLINQKKYSLFGLIALCLFTVSYAYAHFFKNVEECGCFGEISLLNSTAAVSFIRNSVLILFCIIIFRYSPKYETVTAKWKIITISTLTAFSLVLAGYTMAESLIVEAPFENQKIEDTPLSKYVKASPDSTYLVFVFSYNCPHCWDATENVKTYLETKLVDRIIGIAGGTKIKKMEFNKTFKPDFNSFDVPFDSLKILVKHTPTVFIIKNGIVVNVMQKTIPSSFTFKEHYPHLLINKVK